MPHQNTNPTLAVQPLIDQSLRTPELALATMAQLQMSSCPALGGRTAFPCVASSHAFRRSHRGSVAPVAAIKEIFMPALSSTMTEGKIVSWLKAPGDKITKGESVVVVESDKADMDVESFSEGYLGSIVIKEGGVANVGRVSDPDARMIALAQIAHLMAAHNARLRDSSDVMAAKYA